MINIEHSELKREVLETVLRYSRDRDYTGWDLYDGESSRFLQTLPVDSKWLNLAFQQLPRRVPINIRPLLLVEQQQSYLGTSLFALSNLQTYEITENELYLQEAQSLVEWLVENRSTRYSGFGGGHKHPLQSLDGSRSDSNVADIVSTAHATRALLRADEYFEEDYAGIAETAADFIFNALSYRTVEDGACINYRPTDSGDTTTLNANALGARCLLDIYAATGDETLREAGEKILEYVVSKRHESGGWMYTHPPSAGWLEIDNFHNGFIIECLMDYQKIADDGRFDDVIDSAVEFYRKNLFETNGAPNFDTKNSYPKNIHDVSEGILVFSRYGDYETADKIFEWGIDNLYNGDGQFYFEKGRFMTKKITYMRWCQAWMAYTLSKHLKILRSN